MIFGEAVADIVGECSEDKDLSWEERRRRDVQLQELFFMSVSCREEVRQTNVW